MSVAIRTATRIVDQDDVNATPGVGVDEYVLTYDHDTAKFVLRAPVAAPDLSGYALLAGRAGGQTLYGGTAANDDITIHGTSDATRTTSYVLLQPSGGGVGIGTTSVYSGKTLDVIGGAIFQSLSVNGSLPLKPYSATYSPSSQLINLYESADLPNSGLASFGIVNSSWGGPINSVAFVSSKGGSGVTKDMIFWAVDTPSTSNTSIVIKANTGLVGIGTTSPATALHVVGAATITAGIRPAANSTTALQLQNAAGTSILNVDTTNGRVGIGTTAPTSILTISQAGGNTGKQILVTGTGQQSLHLYTTDAVTNQSEAGIIWQTPSGIALNTLAGVNGRTLTTSLAGELIFNNRIGPIVLSSDASYARKDLYIATTGNVGIGTSAPTVLTEIQGMSAGETGSDSTILKIRDNRTTTGTNVNAVLAIARQNSNVAAHYFGNDADSNGVWLTNGAVDLRFGNVVSGVFADLVTIKSTSRVGIGTTAPATALHVVGAATITAGIRPAADSTTALQLQNVAGTSILNVDTTNSRVGIGTTTLDSLLTLSVLANGSQRGLKIVSGGASQYVNILDVFSTGPTTKPLFSVFPSGGISVFRFESTENDVRESIVLGRFYNGPGGAGMGNSVVFKSPDDSGVGTGTSRSQARVYSAWNVSATATRKADLVLTAYDTEEREGLRIRGNGSAPAIGFLGAQPQARIAHVADPAGGATVDAEARSVINSILTTLENFGFHATS